MNVPDTPGSNTDLFRYYQYPDRDVYLLDYRELADSVSVTISDRHATVVLHRDTDDVQAELPLPSGTITTTTNNGILTLEVL